MTLHRKMRKHIKLAITKASPSKGYKKASNAIFYVQVVKYVFAHFGFTTSYGFTIETVHT